MSKSLLARIARVLPMILLAGVIIAEPMENTSSSFARDELVRDEPETVRPPLTPRWAYEPWVWEDEENDADATIGLVDAYRQRDIPVGVVVVDSPWATNYNT